MKIGQNKHTNKHTNKKTGGNRQKTTDRALEPEQTEALLIKIGQTKQMQHTNKRRT